MLGAEGDGGFPGHDRGWSAQLDPVGARSERRHELDEIKCGTHCAFGVVLLRYRRPPDRHDGVPDEFLDRAAIAIDQRATGFEIPAEQLSNRLSVAALRQRRDSDEVGEQPGDMAAPGPRPPRARWR